MRLPKLSFKKNMMPSVKKSMAARMRPTHKGIPHIKINKGMGAPPKMFGVK